MQLLLLKGANIEAKSVHETPIQKAISFKNVESVRFLLARGASPNAVSVLCAPPLILAISSLSSELFEMLLRAGADPNLGSFDIAPLAYAAKCGVVKFLSPLLQVGANPNLTSTVNSCFLVIAEFFYSHYLLYLAQFLYLYPEFCFSICLVPFSSVVPNFKLMLWLAHVHGYEEPLGAQAIRYLKPTILTGH